MHGDVETAGLLIGSDEFSSDGQAEQTPII